MSETEIVKKYLGQPVQDSVTKFCGLVTAVCFWQFSHTRALVESDVHDQTGKVTERWIDLPRLVISESL